MDAAMRWILMARYNPIQVQHIVRHVADVVQKRLGLPNHDLYADVKRQSHNVALSFVDGFRDTMQHSAHPLETGIRIAAAGNIIDFGAKDHASLDLHKELNSLERLKFGRYDYDAFHAKLGGAEQLLYLCDNVGEIDFDKLLMEQLRKSYPQLQITAAMRQSPIINDATVDDALVAGLDQVSTVISSGSVYPGTILSECTNAFRELYYKADLVISKGQGNFETILPDADERVFFMLRIKCDTMAHLAGLQKGELVFMQGKQK
jgi:uncharacterized protein with ATP-grasp and redox domains